MQSREGNYGSLDLLIKIEISLLFKKKKKERTCWGEAGAKSEKASS